MFLSMLAMLVVSAVGATTASAVFTLTEEKCVEGLVSFCWDTTEPGTNLRELKGKEEVQVKLTKNSLLEATPAGGTIHVECTEAVLGAASEVNQEKPLSEVGLVVITAITFNSCKMVKPLNCTVTAEIKTNAITGDPVSESDETQGVLFKPTTGTTFAEIKFSGEECLIKGIQKVTGEQICLWLTPLEDLKGQELICEHSESKLEFGSGTKVKATFEAEFLVKLPNVEKDNSWDITEA